MFHFRIKYLFYFYSYPNTMRSKVTDADSVDGMNKHIIDQMQKQLLQKQNELIDVDKK